VGDGGDRLVQANGQRLQEGRRAAVLRRRIVHLPYVATRAEGRAIAGDDHGAHGVVLIAANDGVQQPPRQILIECVVGLRPIEGDPGEAVGDVEENRSFALRGHGVLLLGENRGVRARRVPQHLARDDVAHDLRGAIQDPDGANLAPDAFDRHVLAIAGASQGNMARDLVSRFGSVSDDRMWRGREEKATRPCRLWRRSKSAHSFRALASR
jgi:hypothetical protein